MSELGFSKEVDEQTGVTYYKVRTDPIDHTLEVEPGILVDVSADGHLVGVEIIPWLREQASDD
jgi:uncharacterized protein YuzE